MTAGPRCQAHIAAFQLVHRMAGRVLSQQFTPEQLVHRVGHSRSNIIWLAGHLTWSLDVIVAPIIGSTAVLPESLSAKFGFGIEPSDIPADYPEMPTMAGFFDAAMTEAIGAIGRFPEDRLDHALPEGTPASRIVRTCDGLLHGTIFHTSYHLGQIQLLMRSQGMPSAFGM